MLAARFVSDVAIFDGTQMAPGTKFTKIWRLKNTGEVPWPPGTQIIFVGGDQMGAALTVPLARANPVQPGEEVDVSVDLIAPPEHGRYVGYWRLTGPMGRRKWGQRVWTHIHVVDPQAPISVEASMPTDKEIEEMAQAASDRENDDGGEEDDDAPPPWPVPVALAEAAPAVAMAATLGAMGFTDTEMVQYVVEKNGADLDACARDLASLGGWAEGLTDLLEMGFTDSALNAKLMIKNGGSVKNTVRDLVADSAQ